MNLQIGPPVQQQASVSSRRRQHPEPASAASPQPSHPSPALASLQQWPSSLCRAATESAKLPLLLVGINSDGIQQHFNAQFHLFFLSFNIALAEHTGRKVATSEKVSVYTFVALSV